MNIFAQTLQRITPLFDAGRVEKTLQDSLPIPSKPTRAPILEEPSKPPAISSAEARIKFKLTQIIFSGNTVFSNQQLGALIKPYLNKTISLVDLQNIVQLITKKYREEGYILSRALLPPQEIEHGIVKIQVIEGFVSKVTISGNPGLAISVLKGYGKHILKLRPLKMTVLERYMLLANDLPGMKVSAVLTPSATIPGSADLTLVTERSRGAFFASYDNYGTRYLGPHQIGAGGSLYSLFAPGDSNNLRVVRSSSPKELKFAEFSHTQPIGVSGWNLAFTSSYTETRPSFILLPLDIIGRNTGLSLDLSYPFIRSRSQNFIAHGLFNYQNVNATITGAPFYSDRIRSLTVGAAYERLDRLRGLNNITLDIEHGFPIWGAHDHFYQSRPDGHTIYTKANVGISRLQGLGSRFSLLASITSQYSNVALLATEQIGFGGVEYGRGYDPSEIVGDRGFGGKLELRFDTAPELRLLRTVQYYIFYDAGVIWNIDNVNLPGKQSLTSAGLGARFGFIPQVAGNFFIAQPLTKPVAVMAAMGHNTRAPRMFFQAVLNYS